MYVTLYKKANKYGGYEVIEEMTFRNDNQNGMESYIEDSKKKGNVALIRVRRANEFTGSETIDLEVSQSDK